MELAYGTPLKGDAEIDRESLLEIVNRSTDSSPIFLPEESNSIRRLSNRLSNWIPKIPFSPLK